MLSWLGNKMQLVMELYSFSSQALNKPSFTIKGPVSWHKTVLVSRSPFTNPPHHCMPNKRRNSMSTPSEAKVTATAYKVNIRAPKGSKSNRPPVVSSGNLTGPAYNTINAPMHSLGSFNCDTLAYKLLLEIYTSRMIISSEASLHLQLFLQCKKQTFCR